MGSSAAGKTVSTLPSEIVNESSEKNEEQMMAFATRPTTTHGKYPMCSAATEFENHDSTVKEESP